MRIDLSEPPAVINSGRALHGVRRSIDVFRLPDLWALHLYSYAATLVVDDELVAIRPGTVSLVPPGAVTEYRYAGPSEHLFAHLRAGRAPQSTGELLYVPGALLPTINDQLTTAVASATVRPERTRALVWLVLLTLAELEPGRVAAASTHLSAAISFIDAHLAEPLTVPQIAAATGVSHTHLTRLFRSETTMTVIGYLRRRRVERARHLLQHSTMSIAAVAASVGIPDLQVFNKTCRSVTGSSPRHLRSGAPDRS